MRRAVPLLATLCWLLMMLPAAQAQDRPLDGDPIWQGLQDDRMHVVPGSQARFDVAKLRAELRRAEPSVAGSIYVVVAPFQRSSYDIRDAVRTQMDQEDVLITVSGVEVATDWYDFADGKYVGDGPHGEWEKAVNIRHERVVLPTYDVTGPIVDVLRLARGAGLAKPSPAPQRTRAGVSTVDALASRLAWNRLYVDPSLLTPDNDELAFNSYEAEDFRRYRVAYLPAAEPGRAVPDPLPALAERFPKDTVVVVRGLWIDAAGPGGDEAIRTSLRYARESQYDTALWYGRADGFVERFYERLGQIRRGVLNERGIPVRPPAVEETGGTLGSWAFAASGLTIGGLSVGGWLWRRARRKRAEERAVRIGRAELAASLAKLAAAITAAESGEPGRLRAEAAERYATAVDLAEQAGTKAELDIAHGVVRRAHEVLDR